jgi:hypothetical protein
VRRRYRGRKVHVLMRSNFRGSGIAILLCFSNQSGDDIDIVKLGIDGERGSLKACISIPLLRKVFSGINKVLILKSLR